MLKPSDLRTLLQVFVVSLRQQNTEGDYKVWVSHSDFAEDSSILGRCEVSISKLLLPFPRLLDTSTVE
jgi:hypothetical protein